MSRLRVRSFEDCARSFEHYASRGEFRDERNGRAARYEKGRVGWVGHGHQGWFDPAFYLHEGDAVVGKITYCRASRMEAEKLVEQFLDGAWHPRDGVHWGIEPGEQPRTFKAVVKNVADGPIHRVFTGKGDAVNWAADKSARIQRVFGRSAVSRHEKNGRGLGL